MSNGVSQGLEADVVVVGGGPAGATVATLLAQSGLDVILIEKEVVPRYHIGESLVPQVLDILQRSGAILDVESAGFLRKEGGVFRWGNNPEPWAFYFDETPHRYSHTYAYQVIRSQFDAILLRHAARSGVRVYSRVAAREFSTKPDGFAQIGASEVGTLERLTFSSRIVVDCTGQSGWLATQFQCRDYDPLLRNLALFAYHRDAVRQVGRDENAIFCEAIPSGWLWNIPLHDGTNSVGLVTCKAKRRGNTKLAGVYASGLASSCYTRQALARSTQVSKVSCIADYSYTCRQLVGPGYLIVGDAGNFVDPVWSTGVFLALQGAEWAAECICKWWPNSDPGPLNRYQSKVDELIEAYRTFIHFFYSTNCAYEGYFWKAYQLVQGAVDPKDAFIRLVSGRLYPTGCSTE